jgi:hypothetical protein
MAGKKQSQINEKPANTNIEKRGRHFSKVTIKNFRCFKDFSIDTLERINLIGGKNNVGKTAFLEALFLLLNTTDVQSIFIINEIRGIKITEGDAAAIREILWSHLFNNYDEKATISISSELETGSRISVSLKQSYGVPITLPVGTSVRERYSINPVDSSTPLVTGTSSRGIYSSEKPASGLRALNLTYLDINGKEYSIDIQVDDVSGIRIPPPIINPIFPHSFLSARYRSTHQEIAKRYGPLEINGSSKDLLNDLNIVEPKLKKISSISSAGGMLYGDIGASRMLPFSIMGDGLVSFTSLLLAISSASNGIVLIDEIDNGLHYSVLVKVWQAIAETARLYNTQVFATTHSWECISAAHDAFQHADTYDFCFHRFQESDGSIEAISLDKGTLQTTIESGWEIR